MINSDLLRIVALLGRMLRENEWAGKTFVVFVKLNIKFYRQK